MINRYVRKRTVGFYLTYLPPPKKKHDRIYLGHFFFLDFFLCVCIFGIAIQKKLVVRIRAQ